MSEHAPLSFAINPFLFRIISTPNINPPRSEKNGKRAKTTSNNKFRNRTE